jgi:DUF1009 family protein
VAWIEDDGTGRPAAVHLIDFFSSRMSKIGLIAGNGRFPFLVLKGARSLGHDVTIVAIKEEAFADLEGSAREARADFHWVSLGHLGT